MNQTRATPPVAPRRPVPLTIHGHTRTDPYYWLREKAVAPPDRRRILGVGEPKEL